MGPDQLVLDLPHDPSRRREDFIVTEANRAALALIDAWPDWPARALLLIGPDGAGKSHLAAIWREHADAVEIAPTAEGIEEALALAPGAAVLVEDADVASDADRTLFHLLNLAGERDWSLLLTARTRPVAWGVTLPDLASRLGALPVAEIAAPDDALLQAVMVKLFSDRQIAVEPGVIAYLTARMERSLGAARALVAELDRLSLAEGRKITRQLAARLLR